MHEQTKNLVNAIIAGKNSQAKDAFDSIMSTNLAKALGDKKVEVASKLFEGTETDRIDEVMDTVAQRKFGELMNDDDESWGTRFEELLSKSDQKGLMSLFEKYYKDKSVAKRVYKFVYSEEDEA